MMRWLVTLLVLVLLVGGGYAAFLGLSGRSASTSAASKLPLCPVPTTRALPRSPGPLRLTVNNATVRNGLAAAVAADLTRRGFHVLSVGNTVLMTRGVATVRYSKDRRLVADRVAAQIKGSIMVPAGGRGVVELDLGPQFRALATAAQAQRAYLRSLPRASATATPTGSCRPRG
jgi:LytR cell envelope-related transcriptional attenuator